jgi:hypothetical protein
MAEDQIIDFIKKERSQKVDDATIKDTLLKAGWKKEQVEDAFSLLDLTQSTEIPVSELHKDTAGATPSTQTPKHHNKLMLVIVGVIIVLLVGGIATVVLMQSSTRKEAPAVTEREEREEAEPTIIPSQSPQLNSSLPDDAGSESAAMTEEQERDAKRKTDITTIQDALERYRESKQLYPLSLNALLPDYLSSVPGDPKTFIPYAYTLGQEGTTYELCAEFEAISRACFDPDNNPQ